MCRVRRAGEVLDGKAYWFRGFRLVHFVVDRCSPNSDPDLHLKLVLHLYFSLADHDQIELVSG